ncbi:hypothetical protein [Dyadobacter sp. 22481]|uniref:hypothetical protein n=1 Tax=Dyadobacter sp. 22481 TaxID=3453926 RepID=UPI003F865CB8
MKAILPLLLSITLLGSLGVHAQQFSPTTGMPCANCHPAGYSMVHTPSISDVWSPSGSQVDKWNIQGPRLPDPPSDYSKGLPFGGGQYSFVTLKTSEGVYDDRVFSNVSGFTIGQTYQLHYSVLSASVHYEAGNNSPYGGSGTMEIFTTGPNAVEIASQTTDIDAFSRNKWITRVITFVPTSSVLQFKMTGTTPGLSAGYINFSIDKYPIDCMLQNVQVEIGQNTFTALFPTNTLNLSTVSIIGATPSAAELVWKTGPNSTDPTLTAEEASAIPVGNLDPANLKSYYAFYYAKDFNCYNVSVSDAELKFMYTPTQVPLKPQTNVFLSCPAVTADLTAFEENPVTQVRWFNNNTHSGLPVFDPKAVPPGDYYAFYYEWQTGAYSLKPGQVSNAHVHVESAVPAGIPDLGPLLTINSLIFSQNGSKDFVVKIQNGNAENSNCSVYFKVSKLPGFNITYSTQAGQSNGINTNNDFWTFSENGSYITVTSKTGIAGNGYSYIGFTITRNGSTPDDAKQNLSVTIPIAGGGGETNIGNNQTITGFITTSN